MRHILHGFVAALPRHGRVVLPLAGVKPDAEVPGMPPAERLPAAPPEGSR